MLKWLKKLFETPVTAPTLPTEAIVVPPVIEEVPVKKPRKKAREQLKPSVRKKPSAPRLPAKSGD